MEFWFVNTPKGGDLEIGALVLVRMEQGGDDLGPVAYFHFFKNVVEVGLYGLFTYVHCVRYEFVGQAANQKGDDLLFPVRKRIL